MAITAGCGKGVEKSAPTQVAARVNAEEISVHQVNAILTKATGIRPESAAQAKQDVLEKLIDQQLAVQQAIEMHLDRTPDVMQAIEAAKAEILAQAYHAQLTASLPLPSASSDETRKFYADHPELFAQRRIFNLQEIVLATDATALDLIRPLVEQGQSIENIATRLKEKGIRFEASNLARPAEQIPLEFLPRYLNLKNGQTILIETPQTTLLTSLIDTLIQPLDEETATRRIQGFLANQRNAETIAREMKRLREKARIERVGEFAATPQPSPSSPPSSPQPLNSLKPDNRNAPASQPSSQDRAIEKGIADLK